MATIYTIGHSTRSLEDFLAVLQAYGIRFLADVRQYPGSRRHPHFGKESLAAAVSEAGIGYEHYLALGGRRQAQPDSPNTYWTNEQFRGYADYMSSPEFEAGLQALIDRAAEQPTVVMCAEALPWRCHRQLIADALVTRGWTVEHLMSPQKADRHALNPQAQVQPDGTLAYPAT